MDNWNEFSSAAGRYRIQFPTEPSETHVYTEYPAETFVSLSSDGEQYIVIFTDSLSGSQTTLQGSLTNIVAHTGGTIVSINCFKYQNFSACDCVLRINTSSEKYRSIEANSRLYNISIHSRNSSFPNSDKFFNSFELMEASGSSQ